MRKLILATAAATVAFSAVPAMAQDAAPFTGPRVEGLIGWDRVQAGGGHDDGAVYGLGVGYDQAIGNGKVILGLDAELSDATTKECATLNGTDSQCLRAGRDLYAGARIGTPLTSNLLLYGKVGYTNARYKITYDDGLGGPRLRNGSNFDGVRVGGGLEYAITPQAFVKTEYRYSNYEAGLSKHQVVAGAGFRF